MDTGISDRVIGEIQELAKKHGHAVLLPLEPAVAASFVGKGNPDIFHSF